MFLVTNKGILSVIKKREIWSHMIDAHSGPKLIFVMEVVSCGNYPILVSFMGTEYMTVYTVILSYFAFKHFQVWFLQYYKI